MDLFSNCSDKCCVCVCAGHCMTSVGADGFKPAKLKDIAKRIESGKYSSEKDYMVGWLRDHGYKYPEKELH